MLALKHSLRIMSKRKKSLGTLILTQVTGASLGLTSPKDPLLPSGTNLGAKLWDLIWILGDILDPNCDREQHRRLEQLEDGGEGSSSSSVDEFSKAKDLDLAVFESVFPQGVRGKHSVGFCPLNYRSQQSSDALQ